MISKLQLLAATVSLWASLSVALGAQASESGGVAADLEGVWTLGSYTALERPDALKSLVLTAAEAEAYEAPRRPLRGGLPSKPGEIGQPESEYPETGDSLARVRGEIRSSWIIDPADGHLPFTKEARQRLKLDAPRSGRPLDNPEDADAPSRCIGNTAAGAPMIGGPDANLFQIVQTPDAVAILTEKYHDVRIVSLGGASAPAGTTPSRLGDSLGHWEGRTLVVVTTDFLPGDFNRGHDLFETASTKVTERFTRTGPTEILYEFTVDDPTLYIQAWRGEMALHPAKGAIFEYACHEGNYSLPSMLRAARMADKTPPAAKP